MNVQRLSGARMVQEAPTPVAPKPSSASQVLSKVGAVHPRKPRKPPFGKAYYFGFGANLSPQTMARRQLKPTLAIAANLPGYQLFFRHIGGYATILPRRTTDRPDVSGVLYELTSAEMWALSVMEGGYDVESVHVETEAGEVYEAQAFVSNWSLRLFDEMPPTKRYLAIMREGARHHNLRAEYQEWLAKVESMFDKTKEPRYLNTPSAYIAAAAVSVVFAGVTALVARPRK